MNPALMNYLQNQSLNQAAGAQPQSQPQPQQGAPSAMPGQDSYNPFDAGIKNAIASARMSLGMTDDQQDNALNNAMLTFGENISQMPREKGFLNNIGSLGRALSPALRSYNQSENSALTENNALANQILAHKAAEEQRIAQAEERLWHRKHAENQLAEQRRAHDMMNNRALYGTKGSKKTQKEERLEAAEQTLPTLLDTAEQFLTDDLNTQETWRGRMSHITSKFTPGGYIPTKAQAKIDTLGKVLRGQLFSKWGYRNKEEFKEVPSVSSDNPPEVNLEVVETLRNLLLNIDSEGANDASVGGENQKTMNLPTVRMKNQNGDSYNIPANEVEDALKDGFVKVNE